MILPDFSPQNVPTWKRLLEGADRQNVKQGGSFNAGRLVLTDSAGVRWQISVSTSGALSAAVTTT